MRIALITLGCAKNLVDAEVMLGLLDAAGHELVGDPSGADVVIINTCAFIASAVDESARVIEDCIELKRAGAVACVVVAGCLPQRYGRGIFDSLPGVDAVVGCSACERIAELVERAAGEEAVYDVSTPRFLYDHATPRILGTPDHLAYVKIAEGCNNHCSYCLIPSLRGALRSRDADSIVSEVEALLELGVVEINLIAQDTTAYGMDIATGHDTAELLKRVAATGAPWIRLLYTHPAHITDELLDTIGTHGNILSYLDVPIQHVSDTVLSAMRRRSDGGTVRSVLARIRDRLPGATIRSTVMVGFPGESERDFEELLEFVRSGAIDHLGVFEFSPEEGTDAASMLEQVPADVARERAERVMAAAEVLAEARAQALAGREETVIVDAAGDSEGETLARTGGQAWETDGRTIVTGRVPEGAVRGSLLRALVTGGRGFDLSAKWSGTRPPDGETA